MVRYASMPLRLVRYPANDQQKDRDERQPSAAGWQRDAAVRWYRHVHALACNMALRVNVGFGVAGTGWRVMLAGVLGLGSWWGW